MPQWPVDRKWAIRGASEDASPFESTAGLSTKRACCLLGAAGLGKTFELERLAALERAQGADVQLHRIVSLATSTDRLEAKLASLSARVTHHSIIYLDALDEALVPVRTAAVVIASWLRDLSPALLPGIRLTCRSAVWPKEVEAAIRDVYGAAGAIAYLQPFSVHDIRRIAEVSDVDPAGFMHEISRTRTDTLAKQPLTLTMLLQQFKTGGTLPASRRELFERGVKLLIRERDERREGGTALEVAPEQIAEVAERLACIQILSGRDTVDLSDAPSTDSLDWPTLADLPGYPPLTDGVLRAVEFSGMCEGDGPRRFRFAHRQIAEYLAGRRFARLLPHQARSLLASKNGWKNGVAAPLRETASFAAMEQREIAAWLAESDPEVIGLSDVADDSLRRLALLALADRFRRRELTDAQIYQDEIQFSGLHYPGIADDLRPLLKNREPLSDDLVQFAVELSASLRLAELSSDLAELSLDRSAPANARTAAANAVAEFGSANAKALLKPLALAAPDSDTDHDLKGIALDCNWPENLTVPELFAATTGRRRQLRIGSYESFFFKLDRSGFCAAEHVAEGLAWAAHFLDDDTRFDPRFRISQRIARNAVTHLNDPDVARLLASLILQSGRAHTASPLGPSDDARRAESDPPQASPFADNASARRILIEQLATMDARSGDLWCAARDIPDFLSLEDFQWLLDRSVDASRPLEERQKYLELARMLPWTSHQKSVDAWLRLRHAEPLGSFFGFAYPLYIELGSEAARQAKEHHDQFCRPKDETPKVDPPPAVRVSTCLGRIEAGDPRFFVNLCQELTLREESTSYELNRHLATTPGWASSDEPTRARVLAAAKCYLERDTRSPDLVRRASLNDIHSGPMSAFWLILEMDGAWLTAQPATWWDTWTWYILRESHLHLSGESNEVKSRLIRMTYDSAPHAVRRELKGLVESTDEPSRHLLESLLELISTIEDSELDDLLCEHLEANDLASEHSNIVARFLLSRDVNRVRGFLLTRLNRAAENSLGGTASRAAAALLAHSPAQSWAELFPFLDERRDLAVQIVGAFAHGQPGRFSKEGTTFVDALGPKRVGEFASLMIEIFPPENDPSHDGMHEVTWDDSARTLRDRLIQWLSTEGSGEAIVALRTIEGRFAVKYPWLRRPRAVAERKFKHSRWSPVEPSAVAKILASASHRLLRSEEDVLDGITEALRSYERSLHQTSQSDLEDFWNTPSNSPASPKREERISDKLCVAVRQYFEKYALTADREVQIYRRLTSRAHGGAPGSEVDLLVRVPSAGSAGDRAIVVPVEVKLSKNPEARTGLEDQLVGRYMRQLGTTAGAFVVAWMDAPGISTANAPIWESRLAAEGDLAAQAIAAEQANDNAIRVVALIVDVSLPA